MKFPSIKEIALALRDTQELIKTDSSHFESYLKKV
jgi:hypothetical protein